MIKKASVLLGVSVLISLVGCNQRSMTDNSLTGTITFNGKPVSFATIMVKGADGTEKNGPTDEQGKYIVVDPPEGPLKFKIVAVPPPPPPGAPEAGQGGGAPAWKPPPGALSLPKRYGDFENEVTFTYEGGKQTFDIELKP